LFCQVCSPTSCLGFFPRAHFWVFPTYLFFHPPPLIFDPFQSFPGTSPKPPVFSSTNGACPWFIPHIVFEMLIIASRPSFHSLEVFPPSFGPRPFPPPILLKVFSPEQRPTNPIAPRSDSLLNEEFLLPSQNQPRPPSPPPSPGQISPPINLPFSRLQQTYSSFKIRGPVFLPALFSSITFPFSFLHFISATVPSTFPHKVFFFLSLARERLRSVLPTGQFFPYALCEMSLHRDIGPGGFPSIALRSPLPNGVPSAVLIFLEGLPYSFTIGAAVIRQSFPVPLDGCSLRCISFSFNYSSFFVFRFLAHLSPPVEESFPLRAATVPS